jgi:hypothetical protein
MGGLSRKERGLSRRDTGHSRASWTGDVTGYIKFQQNVYGCGILGYRKSFWYNMAHCLAR